MEDKKIVKEKEAVLPEILDDKKKTTPATPEELRDLLQKNLKWSQIIYEQNRRINRKIFWSTLADWLRISVLIIPLILGILYLPPLVRKYACLLPGSNCTTKSTSSALWDSVLKILPFSAEEVPQVKAK